MGKPQAILTMRQYQYALLLILLILSLWRANMLPLLHSPDYSHLSN